MKYGEALSKFEISDSVSVLLRIDGNLVSLSEHNLNGGTCSCCKGCSDDDDLEVVRVVDLETMEIFYSEGGE